VRLVRGRRYHFRAVAVNGKGRVAGPDRIIVG
jgi:hypothetical protein